MSQYLTYAHKNEPNGDRFRQLTCDSLPVWAVNVQDDAENLVDGKIPANTVCPFKEKCDPKGEFCRHMGVDHTTTYSCAFARGFEITNKYGKHTSFVVL